MIDLGEKFTNLNQLAIKAIEKIWNLDKKMKINHY